MIGEVGKFAVLEGLAQKAAQSGNRDAIERQRVAREFASFLLLEMIKAMRATIPQGGLSEEASFERDSYMTLADMELARVIAKREGMGLAKMVERALERAAPAHAGERPKPSEEPEAESVQPAEGRISSLFGLRRDPISGENHFHKGVDIAAPEGSPVRAAATGTVLFSGWKEGYGNIVTLDHGNGVVTRYAHNSANLVAEGEKVAAGQEIALVGSSGRSTGSHLHFELLKGGQAVDPLSVVRGQAPTPELGRSL